MAYDYSGLAATAVRLIDKFGRNVTLRSYTNSGSDFDPIRTPSDSNIKSVMVKWKSGLVLAESSNTVPNADYAFLTYTAVTTSNTIVDSDSKEYQITEVQTINPGGTKLIYKARVRL